MMELYELILVQKKNKKGKETNEIKAKIDKENSMIHKSAALHWRAKTNCVCCFILKFLIDCGKKQPTAPHCIYLYISFRPIILDLGQ